ncbi:hypothetical protein GCM10010994_38610 [Chelatococcus reniformis]|uniref:Uncharacterized protein n=1 Tax=Chelatococcus reniformis TaxID=1494448 RepID=A0A916UKK0_9HYPH|nr:hypothetical protein GCM10010994_38610 [Chelatococcus reniformis]
MPSRPPPRARSRSSRATQARRLGVEHGQQGRCGLPLRAGRHGDRATTGNAKIRSAAAQVAPVVITTCSALQAGRIVDVQSAGAAILNAYGSLLAAGALTKA